MPSVNLTRDLFQLLPPDNVIVDRHKKDIADAEAFRRRLNVVTLSSDGNESKKKDEDKEKDKDVVRSPSLFVGWGDQGF